jgi:SAM-dependent methyltransferase
MARNLKARAKEIAKTAWSSSPDSVKKIINYLQRELYYHLNIYNTEPVNLQSLDSSPEALQRDTEYSLSTSKVYLNAMPGGREFLKGKSVLEIGPGINFGLPLILACHGAKVMVADRFLIPWDPDYHPQFYALLRDSLANDRPSIDLTPLDRVLVEGGYPPESLSLYSCSLEELSGVPDQSVDMVISCAVLEHLYDLPSAFHHLARITKPGGLGLHQVDFRDHRDFSRPLEFLLLSDKEFRREFAEKHGECGNRVRPREMQQLLEQVGFATQEFRPNEFAPQEYLTEFLGRLRQAGRSRYCDYPAEDIQCLGGFFVLVKEQP